MHYTVTVPIVGIQYIIILLENVNIFEFNAIQPRYWWYFISVIFIINNNNVTVSRLSTLTF